MRGNSLSRWNSWELPPPPPLCHRFRLSVPHARARGRHPRSPGCLDGRQCRASPPGRAAQSGRHGQFGLHRSLHPFIEPWVRVTIGHERHVLQHAHPQGPHGVRYFRQGATPGGLPDEREPPHRGLRRRVQEQWTESRPQYPTVAADFNPDERWLRPRSARPIRQTPAILGELQGYPSRPQ